MKKLNKSGFTLVEVIAVVAIIGILSAILIPNVTKMINKNKEDSLKEVKETILVAARQYVVDNRYDIDFTNMNLKIQVLVDAGLLKEPIKNPVDQKKLDLNDSYITITYNSTKKDYEVLESKMSLTWN